MAYSSLAERLAANVQVDPDTGCFDWTGNLNNAGYARYSVRCCGKVKKVYAHRTSYELAKGEPIPAGMEIDHTCVNTKCIRPDHLEVVTSEENIRRRDARRAVH
jgi:hypothetical protein